MPPESVAQKLHRRQQELRKKSGLPDPEEYKKRMQQYDKELGMKKESVYVDELPDTGGDSRNIKSVVSDVDPQKKKRMDDALAVANKTSEQPGAAQKIGEAGPFSYGAKPPRRNSLADRIAKKRQEIQRKQTPTEPRDQMVGTAKVMRNEDNNHIVEVTHRIGLTVTDPNHPMVSKRKETIQKTVRVDGEDRENVIKRAIAHYRRKGYKVHDHHYIGTVNEEVEQVDEINLKPEHRAAIQKLRPSGEHSKTMLKHDSGKQIHVTREGDKVHLVTHEIGAGTGKKTTMNYSQFDEAAWSEGAQQLLRKYVPGYAKRQIDKKMDDQKFGRTDVDKDANYYRYKKIQDKLKKEDVERIDEADLMSPAETYKKLAVKHLRDSMNKSATQKQRDYAKMMNRRALEASKMSNHTDALNHYRGMTEARFEIGHAHDKTTRMTYSEIEAKNPKDAIAKSQKPGHELVHVYNMDKETFHHPKTGRKKSNQYEQVEEAWNMGGRNPQRGVKVGDKVRSYDFPGMHDDHYIEGHVVADNPHSYHIRVNKVVRGGKEIPTPAHMTHVEAPKGRGSFSNAYAVHKMMAKQQSVTAVPEPATGAQKTFSQMRGKR